MNPLEAVKAVALYHGEAMAQQAHQKSLQAELAVLSAKQRELDGLVTGVHFSPVEEGTALLRPFESRKPNKATGQVSVGVVTLQLQGWESDGSGRIAAHEGNKLSQIDCMMASSELDRPVRVFTIKPGVSLLNAARKQANAREYDAAIAIMSSMQEDLQAE